MPLPFLVFGFFVLCFALHPFSPVFTHHLADPDDYMRLNQVGAWLGGQSWYDLSVPRLSPAAHTVIHWSRLVDLPIALAALPFIPFFGIANGLLIASLIVPLFWFALLLGLLTAHARFFVGPSRSGLASVMVLFAPMLLFNYTPGRVDHHGIQAIIAGFALFSLTRILRGDKATLFAVLSALAFACGFWIGAEALPWAILFIACLGIAAAWEGEHIPRNAAVFGICLPLFTAALLPIALPANEFSSRALSWFSPAYALFAALSGSILVIGWLASRLLVNKLAKLSLYALLGIGAALAFFALIPSALRGPFTDYDTFDATTVLDTISEAQPLIHDLHFNRFMPLTLVPALIAFSRFLVLPLVALGMCLWQTRHADRQTRLQWFAHSLFLFAATMLTLFWQRRVGIFMELFAILPLTALLCAWWDKLGWGLWDRPLFWSEIGAFLMLGFAPVVLLPALVTKTPLYPDLILFPAARNAPACPLEPVLPVLNGLGDKHLTIMNTGDMGPQLLFDTSDQVIAGNFDVPGNQDAFTFFHADTNATAQAVIARWHADLVLLCRTSSPPYVNKDYYDLRHARLLPGKDGMLHLTNIDKTQPLIERLIRGETPLWLKPIEIPGQSDYLLFRIQHATGKK